MYTDIIHEIRVNNNISIYDKHLSIRDIEMMKKNTMYAEHVCFNKDANDLFGMILN